MKESQAVLCTSLVPHSPYNHPFHHAVPSHLSRRFLHLPSLWFPVCAAQLVLGIKTVPACIQALRDHFIEGNCLARQLSTLLAPQQRWSFVSSTLYQSSPPAVLFMLSQGWEVTYAIPCFVRKALFP